MYDIAIIGGGALGCSSALWLARGGMKVALIERSGLCMEASGRNAGTLTLLYAQGPLLPLMVGGKAMWERAPEWLGADVGHRHTPGLEVAFTPAEAALLESEMKRRQDWGLPIEIIGGNRAREIEPGLSDKVVLAGYSPVDGFAGSNLIGGPFRAALTKAGVTLMEGNPVVGIDRRGTGFELRVGVTGSVTVPAARILLTSNMWVRPMLGWLGVPDLPIKGRSSQVIVTERMRPVLRSILRVVSQISLKQTNNGTFLMGSGTGHPWQDDPDSFPVELKPENCWEKLSIAVHAVPAIRETRVMRTWHGWEGYTPDNQPLVGPVPGVDNAYVMACMRSGWSISPYAGQLMADTLLGKVPERPLFIPEFDPARLLHIGFGANYALVRKDMPKPAA